MTVIVYPGKIRELFLVPYRFTGVTTIVRIHNVKSVMPPTSLTRSVQWKTNFQRWLTFWMVLPSAPSHDTQIEWHARKEEPIPSFRTLSGFNSLNISFTGPLIFEWNVHSSSVRSCWSDKIGAIIVTLAALKMFSLKLNFLTVVATVPPHT